MLFQGFFIQEIDFSFALRYLPEKISELTEFAVAFPLTLLKYALPLVMVILVYVELRGLRRASRAMIAVFGLAHLHILPIEERPVCAIALPHGNLNRTRCFPTASKD